MKRVLARVLALILTVIPWVGVLAVPKIPKSESALVGPLQPEPHGLSQAQPSNPPSNGLTLLDFLHSIRHVRVSLEHSAPKQNSTSEHVKNLVFLQARLQLDGG
jgi:hypothetical protein